MLLNEGNWGIFLSLSMVAVLNSLYVHTQEGIHPQMIPLKWGICLFPVVLKQYLFLLDLEGSSG